MDDLERLRLVFKEINRQCPTDEDFADAMRELLGEEEINDEYDLDGFNERFKGDE